MSKLRSILFERLVTNLAILLGLAQVGVLHWVSVVAVGGEPMGAGLFLGWTAVAASGNAVAVPAMRRARRRRDLAGRLARGYMELGVATLFLGASIAVGWVVLPVLSGLLGVMGAGPGSAFAAFRVASVGLVGSVALALAWGFTAGQSRVSRTCVRLALPGLAPELDGLRVVHISDLHIGNRLEGSRLDRMVARVNAEEPDLVAVTGDIFDHDPSHVEDGCRRLAGLRARYGVYAVLGNHDAYTGSETVASGLARHAPHVRLLRNEVVRVPVPAPFYVGGVEDSGERWTARDLEFEGLERVAAARPDGGPTLLLVHRPELLGQAARHGFPAVLAGHTHGGQIALPTRGGAWNLARMVSPLTRGLYRMGDTAMYVNRGLGVGGPALRFNCPREIATIELGGAADAADGQTTSPLVAQIAFCSTSTRR